MSSGAAMALGASPLEFCALRLLDPRLNAELVGPVLAMLARAAFGCQALLEVMPRQR